ncbi:unnamed protein product, partial [Meganyctiphanes norvegica]
MLHEGININHKNKKNIFYIYKKILILTNVRCEMQTITMHMKKNISKILGVGMKELMPVVNTRTTVTRIIIVFKTRSLGRASPLPNSGRSASGSYSPCPGIFCIVMYQSILNMSEVQSRDWGGPQHIPLQFVDVDV